MAEQQEYRFTVVVTAASAEQAAKVMVERTGYDEDYGFEYQLTWINDKQYRIDWDAVDAMPDTDALPEIQFRHTGR